MLFYVVLALLLLVFVFMDAWYFLRSLTMAPKRLWQVFVVKKRRLSAEELLQTTSLQGMVLPSDLDFHFHMNNSKYLREMDFGRFHHYLETGMYSHISAMGGSVVVGAINIRYRRSLQLWERFTLKTRIVGWAENALYLEQRFVRNRDGFVCAAALLSMSTLKVSLERILEKVCGDLPKPPALLPEVDSFAETISRSKERFRMERTN